VTNHELIERWEQVERVLVDMPQHDREKHFDMDIWGMKTACGTIACAAGHCGLDPWFRERGFALDFIPCDCEMCRGKPPEYRFRHSLPSVSGFFGKTGTEKIFHNYSQRPVETVIAEVREYIAELRSAPSAGEGGTR